MCGDDGNCVQTSSQTRPQPLFAGMPAPTRSTDEERSVQQPDASAPLYSLQPPQEVGCSTSSAKQTVAWYRDLPVSL